MRRAACWSPSGRSSAAVHSAYLTGSNFAPRRLVGGSKHSVDIGDLLRICAFASTRPVQRGTLTIRPSPGRETSTSLHQQ